jgi:CRISPR-associated protein Csb2
VRTSGRPTAYREVLYRRRNQGEARTVYAFALRSADSDDDNARSFDPRDAMEVAAWLRHAAHLRARGMKLAQDFVEHFVCGHGGDQASKAHRFSYVPIPTISPKGRDGRIRRVLVVEPAVGGGRAAEAVARRLAGADLVSEETGEVMAALRAIERAPSDPVLTRYLRRSRRWGTATPIVLPGHDDRKAHKAQRLMLKALVHPPLQSTALSPEALAHPRHHHVCGRRAGPDDRRRGPPHRARRDGGDGRTPVATRLANLAVRIRVPPSRSWLRT